MYVNRTPVCSPSSRQWTPKSHWSPPSLRGSSATKSSWDSQRRFRRPLPTRKPPAASSAMSGKIRKPKSTRSRATRAAPRSGPRVNPAAATSSTQPAATTRMDEPRPNSWTSQCHIRHHAAPRAATATTPPATVASHPRLRLANRLNVLSESGWLAISGEVRLRSPQRLAHPRFCEHDLLVRAPVEQLLLPQHAHDCTHAPRVPPIHRPRELGDGDGGRILRHQEHERLVVHGHLGVHDLPPVDRLDKLAHWKLHLGHETRGLVASHTGRERKELREHPLRAGVEQPEVVHRRVDRRLVDDVALRPQGVHRPGEPRRTDPQPIRQGALARLDVFQELVDLRLRVIPAGALHRLQDLHSRLDELAGR